MKERIIYTLKLLVALLVIFIAGKSAFMICNSNIDAFTVWDMLQVWWHGLPIDLSTCGYLMIIPWLCCLVSVWWKGMPLRRVLMAYFAFIAVLIVLTIGGDMVLYNFWKFKLNYTIFSYMSSPGGAASSTGLWFIIWRVLVAVGVMAAIATALIMITPKRLSQSVHKAKDSLKWVIVGAVLFAMIRGGVAGHPMSVGDAYFSPRLFLNHAAVNPLFSLVSTYSSSDDYSDQFEYMEDEECDAQFEGLYPSDTEDIVDTLLVNQRPNILIVFMESFGGMFVEELGGAPNVSVNLSRLIPEGIFWDNYYANSFRTDRATVSAYGGHVSYPTASLMRMPEKMKRMPGIAKSLAREGYSTTYIYGGDVTNMGKKEYLESCGYENLVHSKHFTAEQVASSIWGANDSIAADRAYDIITSYPADKSWFLGFQTINSHEPFDVPYSRLEDKVLNAFAYTDECVGRLVDRLKATPAWDNMLIILMPDHGFLYNMTYENPKFFHCPMLWLGGAIKEPRRMSVMMNQSDFVATLLSQLSISHSDYPWSRNVLSKNYTDQFVYSTFPSGIMYADKSGFTIFDITSDKVITDIPSSNPKREQRAKVILQKSYDMLEQM